MQTQHFKTIITIPLLSLWLSSCIQLLPDPATQPQIIGLQSEIVLDESLPKQTWQLSVDEPSANQMLDSTRIVIKNADPNGSTSWTFVHAHEWIDRLPKMIQDDVIAAFIRSNKLAGVGRADQSLNTDYVLLLTVYDFQIEQNKVHPSQIHIQLVAQLQNRVTQKIEATKIFEQRVNLAEDKLSLIRDSIKLAYSKLLKELGEWVLAPKRLSIKS